MDRFEGRLIEEPLREFSGTFDSFIYTVNESIRKEFNYHCLSLSKHTRTHAHMHTRTLTHTHTRTHAYTSLSLSLSLVKIYRYIDINIVPPMRLGRWPKIIELLLPFSVSGSVSLSVSVSLSLTLCSCNRWVMCDLSPRTLVPFFGVVLLVLPPLPPARPGS